MTKAQTVRQRPECVHFMNMPSVSSQYSSLPMSTFAIVPKHARNACQRVNLFNMGFSTKDAKLIDIEFQ